MFSALGRKEAISKNISSFHFSPLIPAFSRADVDGADFTGPQHAAETLNPRRAPLPLPSRMWGFSSMGPVISPSASVILASPWRRLQVTRRLEAVGGPCRAAKLKQKGVFKYLRCEYNHTSALREERGRKGTNLSLGNHLRRDAETIFECWIWGRGRGFHRTISQFADIQHFLRAEDKQVFFFFIPPQHPATSNAIFMNFSHRRTHQLFVAGRNNKQTNNACSKKREASSAPCQSQLDSSGNDPICIVNQALVREG